MELLIVSLASLLAGFVDSIVGGGGLILITALFTVLRNTHPATLFGINKGASIWGTAVATAQYARRVNIRWAALLPAAAMGFAGSLAGGWLVTVISPGFVRKALPFVLLAVLFYALAKKSWGATTPRALPAVPRPQRPALSAWQWASMTVSLAPAPAVFWSLFSCAG